MTPQDHKEIGKSIAQSMKDEGMIKDAVEQIIPPILERHKKEFAKEFSKNLESLAKQNGFDCGDSFENQKDLAHLRSDRIAEEGNIRRVKEWAFGVSLVGIAAFLGIDRFL